MNNKESEKPSWKMPENDEYLGNIWGWKVSLYGLAAILLIGSIAFYRHYTIGNWNMGVEDYKETPIDSIYQKK